MSRKLFLYYFNICSWWMSNIVMQSNCVLPVSEPVNTGANMTLFLTSDVINSFTFSSSDPYIVVFPNSDPSLIIGIASLLHLI